MTRTYFWQWIFYIKEFLVVCQNMLSNIQAKFRLFQSVFFRPHTNLARTIMRAFQWYYEIKRSEEDVGW